MRWLAEARERLRTLRERERVEAELDEEMRFHLEMQTRANERAGMSAEEARRQAMLQFGGMETHKARVREARSLTRLENLGRDVRLAARSLRSSPTFTLVAAVTLALGIGANTAVFSVVDGVLLRPLDYQEPDRIVRVLGGRLGEQERFATISAPNFFDWAGRSGVFESAALYDEYTPTLTGGNEPIRISAASVGADFFRVLGISPARGRFFVAEEAEPNSRAVVLSWGLWQERFGGREDVLNSTLELNGFAYTVVGVAAREMEDPGLAGASARFPRLWRSTPGYFLTNGRDSNSFTAVGRLRPGVSLQTAQARMEAVQRDLVAEYPEENEGRTVQLIPLKETIVGHVRPALVMLLAGVGLVLLIACVNVANLLIFRAASRSRETALRAALGASRARIAQYLAVESLLLAMGGGAAGVAVAYALLAGVRALTAGELPRIDAVGLDARVLAFTAAAGVLTALLFGMLPALQATRTSVAAALGSFGRSVAGARGHGRLRALLVAAEVALAVVVVTAGALLGRSLLRLQAVDSGLQVDHALVVEIDPPPDPYSDDADSLGLARTALYGRIRTGLLALPQVTAAGMTDVLPLSGSFNGAPYEVVGQPSAAADEGELDAEWRAATPGLFAALGIRLLAGRVILPSDDATSQPVVVINETVARRHWPEGGAVGQQLRMGDRTRTVVGVVGAVTEFSLDQGTQATIYMPNSQAPVWMRDDQALVVRTRGDPVAAIGSVRAVLREAEPRMPASNIRTLDTVLDRTLVLPRFRTALFGAFALLALLLAVVGVYGLVADGVGRRTRELGVRLALGATAREVVRLVVTQGMRPVIAGTLIGIGGALLAGRLLASLLFGIGPADPLVLGAAPLALIAVATLAAWIPARWAGRIPVMEVLREE